MRKVCAYVSGTVAVALFAVIVQAAAPGTAARSIPAARSLDVIHQEIVSLIQERQEALQQFNARYASAALADRVALEAECANLLEQYEQRYLELVIEYHQSSGNTEELARAEEMLERLNAKPITGTPLKLERNLTLPDAPVNPPQEGTVHDER